MMNLKSIEMWIRFVQNNVKKDDEYAICQSMLDFIDKRPDFLEMQTEAFNLMKRQNQDKDVFTMRMLEDREYLSGNEYSVFDYLIRNMSQDNTDIEDGEEETIVEPSTTPVVDIEIPKANEESQNVFSNTGDDTPTNDEPDTLFNDDPETPQDGEEGKEKIKYRKGAITAAYFNTFDDNFVTKAVLKFKPSFSKYSRIGVNTTSSDKTIDFTEGNSNIKNFNNVFTSDSTNRQINIYKGFLSDKYYAELKMV